MEPMDDWMETNTEVNYEFQIVLEIKKHAVYMCSIKNGTISDVLFMNL